MRLQTLSNLNFHPMESVIIIMHFAKGLRFVIITSAAVAFRVVLHSDISLNCDLRGKEGK